MSLWLIGIGIALRCILRLTKLPFPEHYSILALAPQYNATKMFEVTYQRSLNVQGRPMNAVCHVSFPGLHS